ncbi:hypothetical protein GN956_G17406 [Arapaima gigas]
MEAAAQGRPLFTLPEQQPRCWKTDVFVCRNWRRNKNLLAPSGLFLSCCCFNFHPKAWRCSAEAGHSQQPKAFAVVQVSEEQRSFSACGEPAKQLRQEVRGKASDST